MQLELLNGSSLLHCATGGCFYAADPALGAHPNKHGGKGPLPIEQIPGTSGILGARIGSGCFGSVHLGEWGDFAVIAVGCLHGGRLLLHAAPPTCGVLIAPLR